MAKRTRSSPAEAARHRADQYALRYTEALPDRVPGLADAAATMHIAAYVVALHGALHPAPSWKKELRELAETMWKAAADVLRLHEQLDFETTRARIVQIEAAATKRFGNGTRHAFVDDNDAPWVNGLERMSLTAEEKKGLRRFVKANTRGARTRSR